MSNHRKMFVRLITGCGTALCCLLLATSQLYAAAAPGPDGYGYLTGTTTYDWVDISGTGTPLPPLDDDYMGPFPLGFTFSFYGINYTDFYVQSKGVINFADEFITWGNSCPLPDDGTAKNMIALQWDDLGPESGGTIYHQAFVAGSCPYNSYNGACVVVQFQDVPPYSSPTGSTSTFQGILLDDNSVVTQFKESELGANWGGGSTTGIQGDNYAQDHGISYACNTAGSLYPQLAVQFGVNIQVADLVPGNRIFTGCSGKSTSLDYDLALYNSGTNTSFTLTYEVTSNNGVLTGPATVTVAGNSTESFQVKLAASGQADDVVTATVTAVGGGVTRVANITMTILPGVFTPIAEEPDNGRGAPVVAAYDDKIWSIAGQAWEFGVVPRVRTYDPKSDTWEAVNNSEVPFLEHVYIRSGCQVDDTVYMYMEDRGLYSYNMATNTWNDLTTLSGGPDPGAEGANLNYGAMVHDEQADLCYLTGGSDNSWNYQKSVYVFSPAEQKWLTPLPDFEHGRREHAAWMVGTGTEKKLCIAGGEVDTIDVGSEEESIDRLQTTQCYSFADAAWNAENTDLGALPEPLTQMGFAVRRNCKSFEELWLIGGFSPATWSMTEATQTWYYDTQVGTWRVGPLLSQGAVRCGAVTLDNELYKISGLNSTWNQSGVSEKLVPCKGCFSWPMFMPATTGMGR